MKDFFKQIRDRMKPTQWASWQTLIFLSIFSWIIASLTTSPPPQIVQRIVSSFGWIFLILGVWWFTYEPNVKKRLTFYEFFIGPWFVGALICIYLFGTWEGRPIPTPTAFISWPPISAAIWSSPKFVRSDPKTKSPIYTHPTVFHRQNVILVVLANLVISCWFQFHFQVQDWLRDYSILQAEDFSRSGFVYRFNTGQRQSVLARGEELLNTAGQSVQNQLQGRPWSEVERWLEQIDQQLPILQSQVRRRIPRLGENALWDLEGRITSDAYDLQLQAVWQGPTPRSRPYKLARICRISPSRTASSNRLSRMVGVVQCGPIAPSETSERS